MAVASSSIVKDFDVIKNISTGQIPSFVNTLSDTLFFKELKNDSATALSQQLPRRLMLGSSLFASQNRFQSSLPYWLPWSEWTITSCVGLRKIQRHKVRISQAEPLEGESTISDAEEQVLNAPKVWTQTTLIKDKFSPILGLG
jgi:hypothetical protein